MENKDYFTKTHNMQYATKKVLQQLKSLKLYHCLKCGQQFIKSHNCPNKNIITEAERVKREGRY